MNWLLRYRLRDLPGDLIAGVTVAVMLVPQSLAYASLAGLPPIVGLYASILPVIIYGLFGSSRILTLGPTAITAVMTLGAIGHLAENDAQMVSLALSLALMLGAVYLLMGVLRLGVIINLLSDPVLTGYVNAAALIILISQLPALLGVDVARDSQVYRMLWQTITRVSGANMATVLLGAMSMGLLVFFRTGLDKLLAARQVRPVLRVAITRSGALVVTVLMTVIVFAFRLDDTANVAIIREIPGGLPPLTADVSVAQWRGLLPGAVAIAFVGFMEGISTAKSLLSRKQQSVRPNQELIAMGLANIGAAFTGGMPVTTSISRSAVNFAAGANTGLSSLVAGGLMALTALFLTPLFFYLPRVALAAIIFTSVITLFDFRRLRELWQYSPPEAAISLLTMVSVFVVGIEWGILVGVGMTVALYVVRTSRMEITELGRIAYTDFYDDVRREEAVPVPHVLIVRLDESLYFANARYVDMHLRNLMAERREVRYLVLVCNAVNTVDASAVQVLQALVQDFQQLGVEVYLVGLKGHAFRRLQAANFREMLGEERFFETTHAAMLATGQLIDDELPI